MDTQGWYEVIEFAPDTYQISEAGRWNMFLLVGEEKALSLDGGIGVGGVRRLCESITDLPVEHVLTHTHWDHVGAAHEWESVGVHPGGKDKLANDYTAGCRDFVKTWDGKPFPEVFDPHTFTIPPGKFGGRCPKAIQSTLAAGKFRSTTRRATRHAAYPCMTRKSAS